MIKNKIFITSTDTIVGIGGPINKKVEKAIFKLKQRPKNKKLLIMVATVEEARKFKGWNDNAEKLAKKYWPGQLTIVLDKVGIRIPDNQELINLINKIGPIYMTSANKSGEKAYSLEKAKKEFPSIRTIYDFGKGCGKQSTIVRAENMEIIRKGVIKL